jgi:hypothetical protein
MDLISAIQSRSNGGGNSRWRVGDGDTVRSVLDDGEGGLW